MLLILIDFSALSIKMEGHECITALQGDFDDFKIYPARNGEDLDGAEKT